VVVNGVNLTVNVTFAPNSVGPGAIPRGTVSTRVVVRAFGEGPERTLEPFRCRLMR
jgi:hypothetical protein